MVQIPTSADALAPMPRPLLEEWPREQLTAGPVAVPSPPPLPPAKPEPPADEPPKFVEVPSPPPSPAAKRFPRWAGWVTAGLVVVWLATLHAPPGGAVFLHYTAMIAAGSVLGFGIAKRTDRRWAYGAGLSAGVAAAIAWGRFDYGMETWYDVNDDGVEETYVDSAYRWAGYTFHRKVSYRNALGWHTEVFRYSPSGKLHGLCSHHAFLIPDDKRTTYEIAGFDVTSYEANRRDWYWYDEPITEGEWHLRNK